MKDSRYTIARLHPSMAEAMHAAVLESVDDLLPWMTWAHHDYSLAEALAWFEVCQRDWASGSAYEHAIIEKATGEYCGGCGLNQLSQRLPIANLGYWVRSSHRRQGAATEATIELARWGFRELGLQRIEIMAAVGNLASQGVAAKVGAVREGVLRNRLAVGGQPVDAVMFSLKPGDLGE